MVRHVWGDVANYEWIRILLRESYKDSEAIESEADVEHMIISDEVQLSRRQ